MLFNQSWYSIPIPDLIDQKHVDLLERQCLEREVMMTESQINRLSSHLLDLELRLKKLKDDLEAKVSEEEESKTVGG